MEKKCPKCNQILRLLTIPDTEVAASFALQEYRDNQVKVNKSLVVTPHVCPNCGYVEFYLAK